MSRSGTPTTPRAARRANGRPVVNISLSSEALARLDAMAERLGMTRSGMVEHAIRKFRDPR